MEVAEEEALGAGEALVAMEVAVTVTQSWSRSLRLISLHQGWQCILHPCIP